MTKIINHIFQGIFISKPIFESSSNDVIEIKLFYYIPNQKNFKYKKKNAKNQVIKTKNSLEFKGYKLEKILEKFYRIPVNLQLIRLKSPILNSHILGQLISYMMKNYTVNSITRIILKKTRLKNLEFKNLLNSRTEEKNNLSFN